MKTASKSVLFLSLIVVLSGILALSCQNEEVSEEPKALELDYPETGEAALERLLLGNERFQAGKSMHAHENQQWRVRYETVLYLHMSLQAWYASIFFCSLLSARRDRLPLSVLGSITMVSPREDMM